MAKIITDSQGKVLVSNGAAYNVTAAIDPNIQAGNIKKDVEILGVTGTYEGGGSTPSSYSVKWVDYDGTVLKTDTVAPGGSSTAPTAPTHELLTFVEWAEGNTVSNVQRDTYMHARYKVTSDTYSYYGVDAPANAIVRIGARSSNGATITIDWGDGTVESKAVTQNADAYQYHEHTYSSAYNGLIKVSVDSGHDLYIMGGNYNASPYLKGVLINESHKCFYSNDSYVLYRAVEAEYAVFPTTATKIGQSAFAFTKIKGFTVPASVTHICSSAFEECSIESISIPAVSDGIDNFAFGRCKKLQVVTIAPASFSLFGQTFYECDSLHTVVLPEGVVNLNQAFQKCAALKNLNIPSTVASFTTFEGCSSLESLDLSTLSQTTITQGSCFGDCSSLKSLTLPSGLTSISGNTTFRNCKSLKSLTIPSGCTNIGLSNTFQYCNSLESINLSGCTSLTNVSNYAFQACYALKSVTLPTSITQISNNAFQDCYELTTINIPSSVTTIAQEAFKNCRKLASITLPSGLTSLGNESFRDCYSLTSFTVPSNITEVPNSVFYNDYNLVSVTFEGAITIIKQNAFAGCKKLETFNYVSTSLATIQTSAFSQCYNLKSFYIPATVTDFTNPFSWNLAIELSCGSSFVPSSNITANANPYMSVESMVAFFTNLGTTSTSRNINFGTYNLNRLTSAQKAIATDKGYTLS